MQTRGSVNCSPYRPTGSFFQYRFYCSTNDCLVLKWIAYQEKKGARTWMRAFLCFKIFLPVAPLLKVSDRPPLRRQFDVGVALVRRSRFMTHRMSAFMCGIPEEKLENPPVEDQFGTHLIYLEGGNRYKIDDSNVAAKSRCVAGNGHIACNINTLRWSGRRDSKPHSRVATMPFSLLDLTAKHRCITDLPEFSSLPIVPDFLTDEQNSARIWYHWYHCSPR